MAKVSFPLIFYFKKDSNFRRMYSYISNLVVKYIFYE